MRYVSLGNPAVATRRKPGNASWPFDRLHQSTQSAEAQSPTSEGIDDISPGTDHPSEWDQPSHHKNSATLHTAKLSSSTTGSCRNIQDDLLELEKSERGTPRLSQTLCHPERRRPSRSEGPSQSKDRCPDRAAEYHFLIEDSTTSEGQATDKYPRVPHTSPLSPAPKDQAQCSDRMTLHKKALHKKALSS